MIKSPHEQRDPGCEKCPHAAVLFHCWWCGETQWSDESFDAHLAEGCGDASWEAQNAPEPAASFDLPDLVARPGYCHGCYIRPVRTVKSTRQKMVLYCELCHLADPHRHRGKRLAEMIVGVDCESAPNPAKYHPDRGITENDMISFSFGRVDGTSGSIRAPEGGFLELGEVMHFLADNLAGHYVDADGKVWRQNLFGFHFNHDAGMLLKHLTGPMMLVHKSTASQRGLLCGTEHGPDEEPCEKYHRFSEDACMEIARDGGEGDLLVWHEGTEFAFASTPGRRLYAEHRPHGDRFEQNRRLDVHDVGMAFPGKFEQVIDKWQPEYRAGDREIIAWGKAQRSQDFRLVDREKIAAYSEAECVSLARLIRKFLDALCVGAGVPMKASELYGSGSVAAAAMKFHGVPKRDQVHAGERALFGRRIDEIAQLAYYGGKIEGPTVGLLTQKARPRDINSAYPSKMVHLPCMRVGHGQWRSRRGAVDLPDRTLGYVLANWDLEAHATQFPPFMVRDKFASVYSPRAGRRTWVSLPEWQMASRWVPQMDGHNEIHAVHTVWWDQECECDPPMAFLADIYQARYEEKAKARNEALSASERALAVALEEVYKLIINSCYGKLAQREPTFGKYTNMHWAAMITGATRAQVNEEIWSGEAAGGVPVYVHTDSVTFVGLDREDEGKALGAWGKEDPKLGLFIIQPGLAIPTIQGKAATRGVSKGVIVPYATGWLEEHREELREPPGTWPSLEPVDTRMITLRQAHHIGRPYLAGSFETKPMTIGFRSGKRAFDEAVPMPDEPYAWKLPPKYMIHPDDVAELEDLQSYRNQLKQERREGLWDNTSL